MPVRCATYAVLVASVLAAASASACHDRDANRGGVSSTRGTAPRAISSSAAAGKGLSASDNDPNVVALATGARACPWDSPSPPGGLSQECPEALAWRDASQGLAQGQGDVTLVNMLEDGDERVRWLAASKLHAAGRRFRLEKPLADRVVTAGERETSLRVGAAIGLALADIDLDKTSTFDRIRAMGVKHALAPLRVALIANLAWRNPRSNGAYELTRAMVRDDDKDVRLAAIEAFWMGGGKRPDDTCQIWRDNLDNPLDEDVAAHASELLARFGRCQEQYGALLDSEEHRVKGAEVAKPEHASALGYLCQDPKASHDQMDRATTVLHRMAELRALDAFVRGAALAAMLECDPAGGRAYVKKFADDDQQQVKEIATALLKPRSR